MAPALALPNSVVCRSEHFGSTWYRRWADQIGSDAPDLDFFGPGFRPVFFKVWDAMRFGADGLPLFQHRKMWEWCTVAQVLYERGLLQSGRKGCGFAVGQEPLSSLFASFGVEALATDLGGDNPWKATGQQAQKAVRWPNLIAEEPFNRLVSFKEVDMKDLSGLPSGAFDFTWSSCSMEHLGSLQSGLDFFEGTSRLLKPGGVSVHTTEINLSSDGATLESGDTVLYRHRDLNALADRLGTRLAPLDLDAGEHEFDQDADVPPYYTTGRQHVKLRIGDYDATSVILIYEA